MAILGISHLIASLPDLDVADRVFEGSGLVTHFDATMPLPVEKRRHLARPPDRHRLRLLRRPGEVGVELVSHHGERSNRRGRYAPVVPFALTSDEEDVPDGTASLLGDALGVPVRAYKSPSLGLCYYRVVTDARASKAWWFVCHTPLSNVRFWEEGLGFRAAAPARSTSPYLLLTSGGLAALRAPLVLVDAPVSTAALDDDGWTCISFLVTDLRRTTERLVRLGATDVGEPFVLTLSGRRICLVFLRGPGAELIELFQLV